eukprot:TRINITY_DN43186_c0_g1_i1.p1 TRINITY_DN43186_c0_g1~~TRINITY_DN43186_c0_g1_i1.p1  ORF type:complete len:224 (-),score=15.66 TRINITY_DN43186_c0_g1_i1:367-990(-)
MVTHETVQKMCMHHLFFRHRCMLESDAKKYVANLTGNDSESAYAEMLTRLGDEIEILKLQIKTFKDFRDGQRYVGLVNTVEDQASKEASMYSFHQLQFFYLLLERIAKAEDSENGVCCVSSNMALNMDMRGATQMSQMTQLSQEAISNSRLNIGEKESTLTRLIEEKWISQDEGKLYIGPRTFLELKNYLLDLDLPESTRAVWSNAL